ncbi:AAA family ATPase [Kribbella solani]|uniref:AAA family ATPase n=1 Tax=Kribbella solani TaxID=236067 RepID=UPI0029A98548|nr:AAA family ATPase [Kribbella solani]MDX2971679.1 AAA family ATPase [Kribbella solani]MDX3000904.1 AAA family ATPase [Kribbella solani]
MQSKPMLVVVSGPPGTGKTTLAHRIAAAIGCPAICRDEIKEGMAHATPGFVPGPGDPLTMRTLSTFFDVIGLLIGRGTTVVAEAAFQDRLWTPGLSPLLGRADLRIVHCSTPAEVALARITARSDSDPRRAAHEDSQISPDARLRTHNAFQPVDLPVPTCTVDTTSEPPLADILRFLSR